MATNKILLKRIRKIFDITIKQVNFNNVKVHTNRYIFENFKNLFYLLTRP